MGTFPIIVQISDFAVVSKMCELGRARPGHDDRERTLLRQVPYPVLATRRTRLLVSSPHYFVSCDTNWRSSAKRSGSLMIRGTLCCPPSFPRLRIQAAKVP